MTRKCPPVLWVGLIALAAISFVQLSVALSTGKLLVLVGVVANIALLFGLRAGHRWAYVVALVFSFGTPLVLASLGKSGAIGTFVLNCVVVIPVLLATRWFWPAGPRSPTVNPLVCPHCGYSLLGLTQPRCPECGREFAV